MGTYVMFCGINVHSISGVDDKITFEVNNIGNEPRQTEVRASVKTFIIMALFFIYLIALKFCQSRYSQVLRDGWHPRLILNSARSLADQTSCANVTRRVINFYLNWTKSVSDRGQLGARRWAQMDPRWIITKYNRFLTPLDSRCLFAY